VLYRIVCDCDFVIQNALRIIEYFQLHEEEHFGYILKNVFKVSM